MKCNAIIAVVGKIMACETCGIPKILIRIRHCSRLERSVKCVRPELEMETRKEEQRAVVRFLVAKGAATRHKVKTLWNAVVRNHTFA